MLHQRISCAEYTLSIAHMAWSLSIASPFMGNAEISIFMYPLPTLNSLVKLRKKEHHLPKMKWHLVDNRYPNYVAFLCEGKDHAGGLEQDHFCGEVLLLLFSHC